MIIQPRPTDRKRGAVACSLDEGSLKRPVLVNRGVGYRPERQHRKQQSHQQGWSRMYVSWVVTTDR